MAARDGAAFPGARRRRRQRQLRRLRRLHLAALVAVCCVAGAVVAAALVGVGTVGIGSLDSGCSLVGREPRRLGRTSFLYAANGSLLGAVPSGRHRQPVSLDELSPWLAKATVAIEDRRFWQHGALDYEAIARAALADVAAGRAVQGGSTLTQQLVRNRYLDPSGSLSLAAKLDEACLALHLARVWPKARILGAYLNSVYYGNHAYGVEAAARTYYARPASELTLAQAAVLAGLPQAPSVYDPLSRPEAAMARRNQVLRAMLETGAITPDRYRRAVSRPLGLRPGRLYFRMRSPVFFRYALHELADTYGAAKAREGGLRIQTTVDPRLERLAAEAIGRRLPAPTDPAAALVAIDPRTGGIRAMAAIARNRRLEFNLAAQARRQAGSAFKVFTLTAAVEEGISLRSVWRGPSGITVPDRRCLNASGPWLVRNYADESAGTMTLRQAIEHSVNTIFAQLVVKVGPDKVVSVAHRMGIRSPLKPVCSITLGSQAVSPLEMTVAFATLAARGLHRAPTAVARVQSPSGRFRAWLPRRAKPALDTSVADTVTDALQGVLLRGTGTAAWFGRPAAGKTGTAEDYEDAWFCGYVPQLAACVWVGYPQAEIPLLNVEGFPVVFGGSIPALIWHDFMAAALARTPVLPFPNRAEPS